MTIQITSCDEQMEFQPHKICHHYRRKDLEDDSTNFTTTMSRWLCISMYTVFQNKILSSSYGNYLAIKMTPGSITIWYIFTIL